ncbi:MAG: glycine dehydrogenase, partial [Magnetococcales bacterium]|nr:glycine dehydrogenase [Magnetococcales bacterium]
PLSSGGPYFGFLCCRKALVRQMPGRVAGATADGSDRVGYVLTLQAREQHIRRSRATSNICTNQGLMTVMATIHMALLGPEGMRQTALVCHQNSQKLLAKLVQLPGVETVFSAPCFHEIVVRLPKDAKQVVEEMAGQGIGAGVALGRYYPDMDNCLMVCTTETRTESDLDHYVSVLKEVLS